MDEVVSLSTARQRFNMLLMTVFGAMALLLAAIGIYGLMAYSVAQRTQEIGIRLALGADGRQVRNMVVQQGMRLALAGVVIGLAAAWALARLIASLLFGVKARDPLVFIAVPLVLALVALIRGVAACESRRAGEPGRIAALRIAPNAHLALRCGASCSFSWQTNSIKLVSSMMCWRTETVQGLV